MAKSLKAPLATRVISGAIAGTVGGVAHAVMNELDRRLLNHNADDLIMLGGVFTDDTRLARKIGIGMHLNFAAIFGAVYAVVLEPRNDGDAFRKGVGFALVEHVTLFPLGILLDRIHPHVKAGTADRFFTPTSFVQASLRHLALGLGIGISYPTIARLIHTYRP